MQSGDQAGVSLAADIKSEMRVDTFDRAGTDQIIERRQTDRSVGQMQQRKIFLV